MAGSTQFLVAAMLSFTAALLHVAVIFGGADWYRFFGAGEAMAKLAESGSRYPTMVTAGITMVLTLWGLYALSGAGLIMRLPLLKLGLTLVTAIYLAWGLAGLVLPFVSNHPAMQQNSVTFWLISSLICTAFGMVHLMGLINSWGRL